MKPSSAHTILLVEDESLIAMSEAAMLKKNGYEVITVYNAEKAIESVQQNDIDLILMDIDLGEGKMDGTEAAESILKKYDVPVVFLSSHTEPEVVEKTEKITSYGYIVKNSGDTVLLASIKMAFRLYEAHMELKRRKENLNTALIKQERTAEGLLEREALYRNLMENSIDGVELLDEEGNYLNVNQKECEMLGYSREELLTMKIADIDPNYPKDGFYHFWKEQPKRTSILFETLHMHKDGTLIPVEVNGIFFTVEDKKYIFGVARDIRERKRAEQEIKKREENLRITLNSIGDAVISTDVEGHIIQMNPVAERLCGWSINEAKGKALQEVFHIIHAENGDIQGVVLVSRDVTEQYEKDRQLEERVKELRSIEWMLSSKSGKQEDYIPEYGNLSVPNEGGLILSTVGKEQLKNIASEYLDLLETSSAVYEKNGDYALGVFSSGWCRLMDSASRRLCGTEDNQAALKSGKWLCHESCWKNASHAIDEGRPVEIECNGGIRMCAVPVHANGEIVGAMNFGYGSPPTDEAELETLSKKYKIPIDELRRQAEAYNPRPQFIIDYAKERIQVAATTLGYIIERKLSEDSLKNSRIFLSTVLDTIGDAVVICDKDGKITRFNKAARRLHGLPEKPLSGEQWAAYYDLYTGDGTTPLQKEDIPLYRAFNGERVHNAEIVVKPKDRAPRLLSCSGHQMADNTGEKMGAVIAMHDITEYRQAEEKLEKALKEKDFLMKELNHRVKNNLNMVTSLINLKNAETEIDLSDLKHQIEAIGLIHEKLYQTESVTEIYCSDYIDDLLNSIFSSFTNRRVRIEKNIADIYIPTKTAITLGLIVNEIATNAIKHGFSDKEEAVFAATMGNVKENNQYELTLSNTGNSFPEEINVESANTIGLQLVSALVQQLRGTIELQRAPRPVFTIRFPMAEN